MNSWAKKFYGEVALRSVQCSRHVAMDHEWTSFYLQVLIRILGKTYLEKFSTGPSLT